MRRFHNRIKKIEEICESYHDDPYFAQRYGLSSREEEVLVLMLEGMDNQRIAQHFQVAIGTVKTHTHHIFKKAGVANRAELIEKFWSKY